MKTIIVILTAILIVNLHTTAQNRKQELVDKIAEKHMWVYSYVGCYT